ncbi:GDP-mannose 4,6-dehydratase [Patescibacteria group bacterium]|nr:GDP-mannose 4,6-dehydratase [Patescibacteria group bacterium]MBU1256079.1 GDP-mannose 4,6-dehydratase [Patescibacteria group bacterium]MBU1457619.1 GDP-mannose 4,6-dehydratase [Patescibacteria group bacterium]
MPRKKTKKAFITGITGQDGSYLAEFLLEKGYKVYGLLRRKSKPDYGHVGHLRHNIKFVFGDLADPACLSMYLKKIKPDEIYNLGAQSHVHESWNQPLATADQTGLGALRVFEAVRNVCPKARVYQASTSELFGEAVEVPQTEKTPLNPNNPYAAAKALAHFDARIYRKSFNLFISTGIMFNHESPRRSPDFVTRKVSLAAASIKLGLKGRKIPISQGGEPVVNRKGKLELGNLNSKRDWGFAGDYVEAMWMILQHNKPDDFIVSTGEVRTVKQLAKEAFGAVGLNWKDHVVVNQKWIRPTETGPLMGDHSKITKELGWKPKTTFKQLVKMMVESDLKLLKQ